jgi:hypothetical protein
MSDDVLVLAGGLRRDGLAHVQQIDCAFMLTYERAETGHIVLRPSSGSIQSALGATG